jgi:hypothetical protein
MSQSDQTIEARSWTYWSPCNVNININVNINVTVNAIVNVNENENGKSELTRKRECGYECQMGWQLVP